MKLTAKTEYACLAAIELATMDPRQGPVRVKAIARAQGIPERYLVQILLQLKAAGLVVSARGTDGGYQLARSAHQISVADVIRAIEGMGFTSPRTGNPSSDALADLFNRAREAHSRVLEEISLHTLATQISQIDWVL